MPLSETASTFLGILACCGILAAFAYQRRRFHGIWERGLKAYEDRRFDAAVSAFQRIVKKDPGLAVARRMLGRSLISTGAFEQAEEHLQFALQLEPRNAHARVDMASLLALTAPERQELAIDFIEEAIALEPELKAEVVGLEQLRSLRGNRRFRELAGIPEPDIEPARLN
ncbi:MAG: tetratricopeptide repeat protein [Candidatus Hydrogenedentes bacterium]|nr:tetratricopeptide repeat protein [Candidatus Hydrogenedentota bacterium]